MDRTNRRSFLLSAGTAAAVTVLAGHAAASERVRLCLVGVRGRGRSLVNNFARLAGAEISHVCDVNEPLLGPSAKSISDLQEASPKPVHDIQQRTEEQP